MEILIAKKYIKALKSAMNLKELQEALGYFETVSELFGKKEVRDFLLSPEVSEDKKAELLIEVLKIKNKKLVNFIKLLAKKRRITLFPILAKELKREIALIQKRFEGCVYSEFELEDKEIQKIEKALKKRVGAEIKLSQCDKDYDGIKVEVDIIGVEIDFSKSKIKKQLIEDILKAI
jgi:F-type H+-transporting ATPase subunit delta